MPADAALILAALPQTQCTRCAYPDCAAYAHAIAQDQAAINQCPPGGAEGIQRLAALTGRAVVALNPSNGVESPRVLAVIDEDWCIGCTLCIEACPTDAIFGSNKRMHTVIEPYCTGCELCIPVCPVDCISLENVSGTATAWAAWSQSQADLARTRYAFSSFRRNHDPQQKDLGQEARAAVKPADLQAHSPIDEPNMRVEKRAVVEAAIARARAKRGAY